MIEGVVGLPGSGKTIFLVHRLLEARRAGRRTIANFSSADCPPRWERLPWQSITWVEDAFVAIDEAHMWFPARSWDKTTQKELGYFQQHRKAGLDLIWSAQDFSRVDVALRELTAFAWSCQKVGPFVILRKFELSSQQRGMSLKREILFAPLIYPRYFTEERVLLRDEISRAPIVGVRPKLVQVENSEGRIVYAREGIGPGVYHAVNGRKVVFDRE